MKPTQTEEYVVEQVRFHELDFLRNTVYTFIDPQPTIESECYSTDVIKSVISDSHLHYFCARTAHSMVSTSVRRESNFTVLLFGENKLLSLDTTVLARLLSTEGEVSTPPLLLHEWWICC